MSQADFDAWVARAKQGGMRLDATTYPALAAKSRANPITYYSTVEPRLFDAIIDKYRHSGHAHSAPVLEMLMFGKLTIDALPFYSPIAAAVPPSPWAARCWSRPC